MSEHDFQKFAVEYLRMRGWITICSDMMIALKFIGNNQINRIRFIAYAKKQGYSKGSPDVIIHKNGATKFIEFKFGKGVQSKEQKEMQEVLTDYHVVRTLEELEAVVKY